MRRPGMRATSGRDRRRVVPLLASGVIGILVLLVGYGPEAAATAQAPSLPGCELRLSPESRELLCRATKEGRAVAPERIAASEERQTGKQCLWWVLHQVVSLGESSWTDSIVRVEALKGAEVVPAAPVIGLSSAETFGLEAWRSHYRKRRQACR